MRRRNEVPAAHFRGVDARLQGHQVHEALAEVGALRAACAAVRADRGGIREDPGQLDVEVLDLVALREHGAETAEEGAGGVRGEVGAEARVHGAAHRGDPAAIVHRHLQVGDLVPAVRGGEERLAALLDPLHRAAEGAGGGDHRHLVGVDRALRAERAAHVARGHVDLGGRHPEDLRQPVPRAVRALGRQPHLQPAVGGHAGEHAARLKRDRRDPLADHALADPVGGGLEGRRRVPRGHPAPDGDVALRAVVQHRRAVGGRVQRAGHDGQLVVVDHDQLRRVGGLLAGLRDDEHDRLARPQNLAGGEDREFGVERAGGQALRARQRSHAGQVRRRVDGDDAGRLAGLGHVDAEDARVCQRAAHHEGVQRALGGNVVHVPATTSEERRVLAAHDGLPDEANLGRQNRLPATCTGIGCPLGRIAPEKTPDDAGDAGRGAGRRVVTA